MSLPIAYDYPVMEAVTAAKIPAGEEWQYEPKWDGFRCLAFRDGEEIELRSKSNQPLARYFPELVTALRALKARQFVLDGEICIQREGELSFDDLLMRIHPAESRIRILEERRVALEKFAETYFEGPVQLSPVTSELAAAKRWLRTGGGPLDGVVAKRRDLP